MKELKVYGKKLLATALAGVMALSLCACDEEDWDDEGWEDEPTETSTDDTGAVRAANVNAMQMSVNKDTGEMSISRPQLSGEAMGAEGTWTIFVTSADLISSQTVVQVLLISRKCVQQSTVIVLSLSFRQAVLHSGATMRSIQT